MKNFSKGITLIEIMVVVSLITVITGVFVSDFPKIKLELGLSRVLHTMVLDIKTAQALSGSGHQEILPNGSLVTPKGYGIYINTNALGNKKYLLYAAATVPALTMSYLRILALKHFPSDALVGIIVGSVCGIAIPALHHIHNKNLSVGFFASPYGAAGLTMNWNLNRIGSIAN